MANGIQRIDHLKFAIKIEAGNADITEGDWRENILALVEETVLIARRREYIGRHQFGGLKGDIPVRDYNGTTVGTMSWEATMAPSDEE